MATRRRGFGSVRRLKSGRWQVRYAAADGAYRTAPRTFATNAQADRHLAEVQTDLAYGRWFDPTAGKVALQTYADSYLHSRTDLATANAGDLPRVAATAHRPRPRRGRTG